MAAGVVATGVTRGATGDAAGRVTAGAGPEGTRHGDSAWSFRRLRRIGRRPQHVRSREAGCRGPSFHPGRVRSSPSFQGFVPSTLASSQPVRRLARAGYSRANITNSAYKGLWPAGSCSPSSSSPPGRGACPPRRTASCWSRPARSGWAATTARRRKHPLHRVYVRDVLDRATQGHQCGVRRLPQRARDRQHGARAPLRRRRSRRAHSSVPAAEQHAGVGRRRRLRAPSRRRGVVVRRPRLLRLEGATAADRGRVGKAARGDDRRPYPWGSTAPGPALAVFGRGIQRHRARSMPGPTAPVPTASRICSATCASGRRRRCARTLIEPTTAASRSPAPAAWSSAARATTTPPTRCTCDPPARYDRRGAAAGHHHVGFRCATSEDLGGVR